MKIIRNTAIAAALLMMGSCTSTRQVAYLQDVQPATEEVIVNMKNVTLQPGDQISIIVTCKDPQIASLFNLVTPTNRIYSGGKNFTNSGEMGGYTVSSKGDIDFPQLGEVHVAGLTREGVANEIKNRLVASNMVKDPVVTVDFLNLHFSVIGEVSHPGYFQLTNDRTTLLDALSLAGDMTIYGKRDNVAVVREENGRRTTYVVDVRSKDLFDSPAYYLQQNDVVYVQPNKTRAGQSNVNENQWKNASLWMSLASVLTSVAVLIWR